MKISRTTALLAAFAIFVGAAFAYLFLVSPTYQQIMDLRGEIEGIVVELDEKREVQDQVRDLLNSYENVEQERGTISAALPLEAELPSAAAQIALLAERNFLTISGINFDKEKTFYIPQATSRNLYGYARVPLKIDLVGSYEAFRSFVRSVEANMRLFDFQELTISAKDFDRALGGEYEFSIKVYTYYQTKSVNTTSRLPGRRF